MTVDAEAEVGEIAVLVTDTPHPLTSPEYGDYGDQGINLLNSIKKLTDKNFKLVKYKVIDDLQLPNLQDLQNGKIKAIYVTGSKFDSFGKDEWILKLVDFLKLVYYNFENIPLIGVCFGHQIIAVALGSKTERNPKGWELGVSTISTNPEIQNYLPNLPNKFNIVEFHHDIVTETPKGTICLGSTDSCKIQGFYKKDKVLTFQGHPEFNTNCCQILAIEGKRKQYVTDEMLEEITNRNNNLSNDQTLLANIIGDFLINI